MREHGVNAADIESVTAHVSHNTLHHCGWAYQAERIQSVLSAQMNLRYGLAVMALERDNGVAQFDESKIRDPKLLQFVSRIRVEHEPAFELENGRYRVACRRTVRLRDGIEHETTVRYRRGSPEDPMSCEQLVAKFENLSARMGSRSIEQMREMIFNIETSDSLHALARSVAADPANSAEMVSE